MNRIVIANWKMKLSYKESLELAKKFKEEFKDFKKQEVAVCPSFISLSEVGKIIKNTNLILGAQNVFWEDSGSFTGEVSAQSLQEAGCKYVIIGHSERRRYLLENYEMIHQKVKAVLRTEKLVPVVCIGEKQEDRKTERRDFILIDQLQQSLGGIKLLDNQQIIVAYEPVWAIGSGTAIEPVEAEYAHKIIRLALNDMFSMKVVENNFKIIYGGSISGKNVKDFVKLKSIDGFLVGGASLDAREFKKISKAFL